MLKWTCVLAWLFLPSCTTVSFYRQALGGQLEIMQKSRPNEEVLEDAATPEPLKAKLRQVEEIRSFAEAHLSLPGHDAYGRYADLGREHVTWVLYAAPEFSLKPKTWWYPTLGKLDYRGYFREADAQGLADELKGKGYDVYLGGVDAYSTLGWLHDPVLNTFIEAADVDLAELIFHELTHRKYFRNGATAFNESLANAVAEEGVQRWLAHHGRHADLKRFRERLVRRAQFYDRIDGTRSKLEALYASGNTEVEMRRQKKELYQGLQDHFRELRRRWGGRGLEGWLKMEIGNAHLVSVATYHKHLPFFREQIKACGGDLELFFQRVKTLELPK